MNGHISSLQAATSPADGTEAPAAAHPVVETWHSDVGAHYTKVASIEVGILVTKLCRQLRLGGPDQRTFIACFLPDAGCRMQQAW